MTFPCLRSAVSKGRIPIRRVVPESAVGQDIAGPLPTVHDQRTDGDREPRPTPAFPQRDLDEDKDQRIGRQQARQSNQQAEHLVRGPLLPQEVADRSASLQRGGKQRQERENSEPDRPLHRASYRLRSQELAFTAGAPPKELQAASQSKRSDNRPDSETFAGTRVDARWPPCPGHNGIRIMWLGVVARAMPVKALALARPNGGRTELGICTPRGQACPV
jgi:hypothetical protein